MSEAIVRSERLHPEVRALLEVGDARGLPPIESLSPEEARAQRNQSMQAMAGDAAELGRVEDVEIPGPGGALPLRVYALDEVGPRPALVYFHGGGFVVANLETHDAVCRSLAQQSGAVVIAVDFRLAPEHKFPAAVDDAYAATVWVAENAEQIGVDRRCISVGGDSAGGELAAVVCMRCRQAGGPALAAQVLIYPLTDLSSCDSGSYRDFARGYWLTRAAMLWFRAHYLPSAESGLDPEASPLLARDLSGLPPALVITAEFDPLRDEGEAYARRLEEAGVPVTLSRYPGMVHGFVLMRGILTSGREAIRETAEFLKGMVSKSSGAG